MSEEASRWRRRLKAIGRSRPARPLGALLILAALLLPWPGLGPAYARLVAALGGTVLGEAHAGGTLRFKLPEADGASGGHARGTVSPWRLDVVGEDGVTGRFVGTAVDLRRGGYIASAVFAALALVTPLRWRRRVGLLAVGLLALQTLPLLPVVTFFSGKLAVKVFTLGPLTSSLVDIAYHAMVAPPGMAYAVPAMLWLALVWLIDASALPGLVPGLRSSARSGSPPASRATARSI